MPFLEVMNDIVNVNFANSLSQRLSPNASVSNHNPHTALPPQLNFNSQPYSFNDAMGQTGHMHHMEQMSQFAHIANGGAMTHGFYDQNYAQPSGYSYVMQPPSMQPPGMDQSPHGMHGHPGIQYPFAPGNLLIPGTASHLSNPVQPGFVLAHAHSPGSQAPPDLRSLENWSGLTEGIPDGEEMMIVDSRAPGTFSYISV